ncbi:MAG: hypothetical protein MJE66_18635 [Proteobacteria bacterium]|nr:hypothetical protein [Pseudomonadota bacterium]
MPTSHWVDEERVFDSVVALTDDVIYVANPPADKAKAMKEALDRGESAATVVKDGTTIVVQSIKKVKYNRHDDDIDIDYRSGKDDESKNISFSDREERDAFAAQLTELLHGFETKIVEYGPVRAALGPVVFGAIAALMTFALHGAAQEIAGGREMEFQGRNSGIKSMVFWLLDAIGPIGVLVVGALVLGLTALVLVSRVKTPPIMHTLKPRK